LLGNQCIVECGNGYFENTANNKCDLCVAPCATCNLAANICISCQGTLLLYRGGCVSSCPAGTFLTSVSGTTALNMCGDCDISCYECEIKATRCTKCFPRGSVG